LYTGKRQLNQSLPAFMQAAETASEMDLAKHQQTIYVDPQGQIQ
jgi:hypothetical protein